MLQYFFFKCMTGVNCLHPDLAGNCEVPLARDVLLSRSGDANTDYHGHGTHAAGIVGAVGNNSLGVAGVAWTVRWLVAESIRSAPTPSKQNFLVKFICICSYALYIQYTIYLEGDTTFCPGVHRAVPVDGQQRQRHDCQRHSLH